MTTTNKTLGGGIEVLRLTGHDAKDWGRQHGRHFKDGIQKLYATRLQLTLERTDLETEANVLALAAAHLPVLRDFDAALADEVDGIAEGAELTAAHIMLVNHYTDLRDLSEKDLPDGAVVDEGGCSVIFHVTDEGPVLSQTWDMHGSATDHVMLLEIPEPDGGFTEVFSIHGCVGMTGLTSWGLGMTINNLNSTDAVIGVMWPGLVRRCLREKNAKAALDVLQAANIGSGHHYVVADENDLFGLTTSGTKKKLLMQGHGDVWLHTNHVLDDEMAQTCRVPEGSSSLWRRDKLEAMKAGTMPTTMAGLWASFDDVSMPIPDDKPHHSSTCGAVVMNLKTSTMWACKGLPAAAEPLVLPAEENA